MPKKKLPKPENFHKTPKPRSNTSPLARYRHGAAPDVPDSAPAAQAVYYGCCSITNDEGIPIPQEITTVPGSDKAEDARNGHPLRKQIKAQP